MTYAIETSNLSVTINGALLLKPTSLYVNVGEAVGIVGLNGAGKSTIPTASPTFT